MLVPIAKDRRTGNLVELESPNRSIYAECVCPSCEQSVIPRLGDTRVWHFAHAVTPKYKPARECELSFYACCRQYIIELARRGEIRNFTTPDYVLKDSVVSNLFETVTTSRKLIDLPTPEIRPPLDLVFPIKQSFHLGIHLSYEGRQEPQPLVQPGLGIVSLDLNYIDKNHTERIGSFARIRNLTVELFEDALPYKRWIYHPREEESRRSLEDRRNSYRQETKRMMRQKENLKPATRRIKNPKNLTNEEMDEIIREFRGPNWRREV